MTPFGEKVRGLREVKGVTLREMAKAIGVSGAYLSALEHGKRSRPSWHLVQRIIVYFNVIWDDAEELARLARMSRPKVTLDTSGLDPMATELANRLSHSISRLDRQSMAEMLHILERNAVKPEINRK
jgi:transcriptional regulator with XRE-family HTH domain